MVESLRPKLSWLNVCSRCKTSFLERINIHSMNIYLPPCEDINTMRAQPPSKLHVIQTKTFQSTPYCGYEMTFVVFILICQLLNPARQMNKYLLIIVWNLESQDLCRSQKLLYQPSPNILFCNLTKALEI